MHRSAWFVLCSLLAMMLSPAAGSPSERLLLHDLFDSMDVRERPVLDSNDAITVTHSLKLIHMFMNEETDVVSMHVWEEMKWNAYPLIWNETNYNNISSVRIQPTSLWLPDIRLFNRLDVQTPRDFTPAVVSSDGSVTWIPASEYRTPCFKTAKSYRTIWTCKLRFGSWTYHGLDMDLHSSTADGWDVSQYLYPRYTLSSYNVTRAVVHYDCCKEAFQDLTYTLEFFNSPMDVSGNYVRTRINLKGK